MIQSQLQGRGAAAKRERQLAAAKERRRQISAASGPPDTRAGKEETRRAKVAGVADIAQPLSPIVFTWEIAPWASLTTLIFVVAFDLRPMIGSPFLQSTDTFLPILGALVCSGTLVCIDVLFARTIIQQTSALTLSILSSLKELVTIGAGVFFFDDVVTMLQIFGVVLTILGVKLYTFSRWHKHRSVQSRDTFIAVATDDEASEDSESESEQLLSGTDGGQHGDGTR